MIFLDNASTTSMFKGCVGVYEKYSCNLFYNPSAGYQVAIENANAISNARETILRALGETKGDILFTSGATESNNLAIIGSARSGKSEYVVSVGEHPSVYNAFSELKNRGAVVHFVGLDKQGFVDLKGIEQVLNENTRLISVMHVSNETGAVNNLRRIDELRNLYCPNALFHVDGVQAFCKIPFSINEFNADLYSFSGHKFHGPKGVGGLYVKNKNSLKNINFGGGQELGKRSGTENLPAVMAMKYAIEQIDVAKNYDYVLRLKKVFLNIFLNEPKVSIISAESPFIISMSFAEVNGETLMRALEKDVVIGTGSACSTKKSGNRVLESMGYDKDYVKSSVRISFNAYQSEVEVVQAGKLILDTYKSIWEKVK